MKFSVIHETRYAYAVPVVLCHNEARLLPRAVPGQICRESSLTIDPLPAHCIERVDSFGNRVVYFALQAPHDHLVVTARSEIDVMDSLPSYGGSPAWDLVRAWLWEPSSQHHAAPTRHSGENRNPGEWQPQQDPTIPPVTSQSSPTVGVDEEINRLDSGVRRNDVATTWSQTARRDAVQFALDSTLIATTAALADYAAASFTPGRPLLDAIVDLTARIHHDYTFDPESTTVATPLVDVVQQRRGVCQDFAHLAIGCVRATGLAARYVSGYLETVPPPRQPRLQGADRSHAWFSTYVPGIGWVDADPTNNQIPPQRHITIAWGRDYADVAPLKGVIFGGGTHTLKVAVDVIGVDPHIG